MKPESKELLAEEGTITASGDLATVQALVELLDTFDGQFPIVFP
ncbi:alkyl sulfatase BDS1-like metallo-beta-lactamase superfamily hydrolase [Paenibacillus phyllosphaerae]|uniref:Alkyl sulfatase BDS1-like metallo-beta-lactamase superfamily hydrolase n=1 Tax=Paenibacillus phyllosphaerae TaxID=274593 RepID=A0A7W5AW98_9BACL|nr:hypothetical protein [Paenibacillus phyllosphaerae]MBB3109644.1 alkyl sulfatase BDS1-like metallo-beta-lactamase superfamily hydrolase [Paenibacillus phyllosphaerae]